MLYINANIFTSDAAFVEGSFRVENGVFTEVCSGAEVHGNECHPVEEVCDLGGAYVIPGLIDVHLHGGAGVDFCDAQQDELQTLAAFLAQNGVTSFAPASLTLPFEKLKSCYENASVFAGKAHPGCSVIRGIQMEGPFFSVKKKGAQNEAYLHEPDYEMFKDLFDASGGLIKIVDIAPELPGAIPFIEQASAICRVSIAHTDADYDTAKSAISAGVTHLTHLFNAMPSLHHRQPGVIPAAIEDDRVTAEVISDGHHVHPAMVRLAFQWFKGRICLVSDALQCCGLPNGDYALGGQKIWIDNGVARLMDGTIAGAASTLYDDLLKAVSFGVRKEEAILAATLTPARELGCGATVGSIETGKTADFIVCDEELNRKQVYMAGERIHVFQQIQNNECCSS